MPDAPLASDTGEDEPGSGPTGSFRTHLGRIAIAAAMTVAAPVIRATILAVSMSPLVPLPFAGSAWSGLTPRPTAGVSRPLALRALAVALALETCLAVWHFSAARTDAALTGSWSRRRCSPLWANDQGNPAAAKNLRFQNLPDPPLGLAALFGITASRLHSAQAAQRSALDCPQSFQILVAHSQQSHAYLDYHC